MSHDRRSEHADADAEDARRRAELALLLVPDHVLDRAGAAAAVLGGPGETGPAVVVLGGLPLLGALDRVRIVALQVAHRLLALHQALHVLLEERAGPGAELGLFRGVVEIHRRLLQSICLAIRRWMSFSRQ